MTAIALYLLTHFLVCTLFFGLVQRPLFFLYNRSLNTQKPRLRDWIDTFWHGLYTDVKTGSYMTALPLLLLWCFAHYPHFNVTLCLSAYDVLLAAATGLLCVADTALYKFWQFKIEASVLAYLRSLKGAFASVSAAYVATAFAAVGAVAALLAAMLLSLTHAFAPHFLAFEPLPWWGHVLTFLAGVALTALLYIIIRGLHIRPDTPVCSYYCNNQFLNHTAVNPAYNFIYSLHIKDDYANQFQAFDPAYCQQKFAPLFPTAGTPRLQLLNTQRPNIVVIVWESLCAQFMECLGGRPGVMPHFSRLAHEGVLFTNCWAGSFRTDRGLVCILSGYPGQPTTSVILHTAKLPHLPALPRRLRDEAGYRTMALHGGELNIFHKSDYYWASGHDRLVEQKDFPADAPATRWGIHDHYMFEWLAQDIIRKADEGGHWFTTFQTLSSHEPFRVPYQRIADNPVDNAFAYSDEAFGHFVETLKASTAWKDLLIVVIGDHGLDTTCAPDPDRNTHLPLLLLGGAVSKPMQIDTLMSQTDIAATLLGQMGMSHDDFTYSRDVLADTYTYPFALHTYNNAFIFRDATGVTHYDNVSEKPLEGADPQREETAKVILQTLYDDLSHK